MLNKQILDPESIVVVGGSNHLQKPGGKVLNNLINGGYKGSLYVVNPKEKTVQDVVSYPDIESLPDTDLAILAIPAQFCPGVIRELATQKKTRGFIVLSAGFSETGEDGQILEKEMTDAVNEVDGCLIGPNCIGILNTNYHGVFTTPIPELTTDGCDLISSSGATAVFLMETGMSNGLRFSSVFSVGNAAQTGVEEVLEYMDIHHQPRKSAKTKLVYAENIRNPRKFLKHASSLINKGCHIAAIKAGSTPEGSKAAASHTGALATSDVATRALFRKAGVIYCSGRAELITVASVLSYKQLKGENIAIITHAGGSAVMLTDALVKGGLKVPEIKGKHADELIGYLNKGSSVSNPIDFLATGTADQLGTIIDYCEHKFRQIDGMIVVFGSPGLFDVENVYKVLNVKLDICKKPIYPVLPSIVNAGKELEYFLSKGRVNFPDEVVLGNALCQVYHTGQPITGTNKLPEINVQLIRTIIDEAGNGFLPPSSVESLLDAANIPRIREAVAETEDTAAKFASEIGFPVAMKVVGPVHKSDVGGVVLNIKSTEQAMLTFRQLMMIKDCQGVLIQSMFSGTELYLGAVYEKGMGHLILCGLGGIFIEVLNDVSAGLSPLSRTEAHDMLKRLKGYQIIKGLRNQEGVNEELIIDLLINLSAMLEAAPEIVEMDINPLTGRNDVLMAVDTRIRIDKGSTTNN